MKSSRSPHRLVSDPAYPRLKDYLISATGLAYYADKDADLMGRIAQRLAQLELPDCATYLALLQNGEGGERQAVTEESKRDSPMLGSGRRKSHSGSGCRRAV